MGSWATKDAKRVQCLKCGESCVLSQVSTWKDFQCGTTRVGEGRLSTDHVLDRRSTVVDKYIEEGPKEEKKRRGYKACVPVMPTSHDEPKLECKNCTCAIEWRRHREFLNRPCRGRG